MNDLKGIIEDCNKSDLISDKVIKKIIEIIGQEEWNDLHDENSDICTTMGELIITLKGIPDLEKENAILKCRTEGFEKQILGLLCKYESVYKRFPDLKDAMNEAERVLKENAELKSELTKKADTNLSLVEQMADLESENAELKKLRCCENCNNVSLQLHWKESKEIDERRQFVCGTCGNRKHWEYLGKTVGITETQHLTKAKEIIREIMKYDIPTLDYEKAEQFLK